MKPCSLPTCRAGLHQVSAAKSHIIFLATFHKKDKFEEFLCYSYTLFLLCDGPKQEDRAKPRFMYRKRVLVTPGIGASTSHTILSTPAMASVTSPG